MVLTVNDSLSELLANSQDCGTSDPDNPESCFSLDSLESLQQAIEQGNKHRKDLARVIWAELFARMGRKEPGVRATELEVTVTSDNYIDMKYGSHGTRSSAREFTAYEATGEWYDSMAHHLLYVDDSLISFE